MDWTEKDVKTWKRSDAGGVYYVRIPGTSGWKSSGLTRKAAAIEWALRQAGGGHSSDTLLGEYAKDFFIPGLCPIVAIREATGGKNTLKHWDDQRAVLEHYILPRWGKTMVGAIDAKAVFGWLSSPELIRAKPSEESGQEWRKSPLSGAHRNRILIVFRAIMAHAVFDRLIQANPLVAVPRMRQTGAPRGTFDEKELAKLFPLDEGEMARIWGGLRWATLYMILADTGLRPSEALALRWRDWHGSAHAFVVSRKIDSRGQPGPLKTARKGIAKRVALVRGRTAELIDDLMEARLEPGPRSRRALPAVAREDDPELLDGLLFPATRIRHSPYQPMRVGVAGIHFAESLERAGVEANGRTLYCLRHTANTGFRTELGDEAARLLMGHTNAKMTEHYDHPEDAQLVVRALKAVGRG
jgi:integrase